VPSLRAAGADAGVAAVRRRPAAPVAQAAQPREGLPPGLRIKRSLGGIGYDYAVAENDDDIESEDEGQADEPQDQAHEEEPVTPVRSYAKRPKSVPDRPVAAKEWRQRQPHPPHGADEDEEEAVALEAQPVRRAHTSARPGPARAQPAFARRAPAAAVAAAAHRGAEDAAPAPPPARRPVHERLGLARPAEAAPSPRRAVPAAARLLRTEPEDDTPAAPTAGTAPYRRSLTATAIRKARGGRGAAGMTRGGRTASAPRLRALAADAGVAEAPPSARGQAADPVAAAARRASLRSPMRPIARPKATQ
jgi:hypothetical protein